MTAAILVRSAGQRRETGHVLLVALAAAAVTVAAAGQPDVARGAVAAAGLAIVAVVAFTDRRLTLLGVLGWLVLLGFVRRFLIPFAGWAENDPLLLVSPAAAVLLLLAARRTTPRPRTLLTSLVTFQLLWVAASVFNPNEGDIVLGAQGALFYAVPMLWFFVGRTLNGDVLDAVQRWFLVLLVPVLALGYYHTFVGFLPFELTWLHVSNVSPALIFVRGFNVRPFSTLMSPQEYGMVLSFGALVVWAKLLHERGNRHRLAALFALLVVALFLQGSRGIFLAFFAGLVVTAAVRLRSIVLVSAVISAVVAGLFLVSQGLDLTVEPQTAEQLEATDRAGALWRHQIEGLLNPSSTTAPLHVELWTAGFRSGLENPLGNGPSNHSIASFKQRRDEGASPENELSITASALGLPAALALLAIYGTSFVYAFSVYRRRPTARHLAWLGLLVTVGDQALNGRLYFTSTLVALVLGALSTEYAALRRRSRERTAPAPDAGPKQELAHV